MRVPGLTVSELALLKEALKMAGARHASQARELAKRNGAPSNMERIHEEKARRMETLRIKLTSPAIAPSPCSPPASPADR